MRDIEQIFSFIVELEKLKHVQRRTKVIGLDRYENSAEHSWTVALTALLLHKYISYEVEIGKVIKMLLVHDIVEVDAGDKFIYSPEHHDSVNETKAAQRLFNILPEPMSSECMELWLEFENRRTPNANYAYLVDRLVPIVINLNNNGQSWRENKVSLQQVIDTNCFVEAIEPKLWRYILSELQRAHSLGWLH